MQNENVHYDDWSEKKLIKIYKKNELGRRVLNQRLGQLALRDKEVVRIRNNRFGGDLSKKHNTSNKTKINTKTKRNKVGYKKSVPHRLAASSNRPNSANASARSSKKYGSIKQRLCSNQNVQQNKSPKGNGSYSFQTEFLSGNVRPFTSRSRNSSTQYDQNKSTSKIRVRENKSTSRIKWLKEPFSFPIAEYPKYMHINLYETAKSKNRPYTPTTISERMHMQKKAIEYGQEALMVLRKSKREKQKLKKKKLEVDTEIQAKKIAGFRKPWRVEASRLRRKRMKEAANAGTAIRSTKSLENNTLEKSSELTKAQSRQPSRQSSRGSLRTVDISRPISKQSSTGWKKTKVLRPYTSIDNRHRKSIARKEGWLEQKLRHAAQIGNTSQINSLIARGAVVNSRVFSTGRTALHFTAAKGHLHATQALIKAGADTEARDMRGRTPLEYSRQSTIARGSNAALTQTRISRVAKHIDRFKNHRNEEYPHTSFGGTIESIISAQSTIHEMNELLLLASAMGHTEAVEMLIAKGAHVHYCDAMKRTPLHHASLGGHAKTVRFLLHSGANIEARDAENGEVMRYNTNLNRGFTSIIPFLLDSTDSGGMTPLQLASTPEVKGILVETEDVQLRKESKQRKFRHVCGTGSLDQVKELLNSSHIHVNDQSRLGETALHFACREGNIVVAKFLVEQGADPKCKAKGGPEIGWTPLHHAAYKGHAEIVALLAVPRAAFPSAPLLRLTDIDVIDASHRTPLHLACFSGHSTVVAILLEQGANCFSRTKAGLKPRDLVTGPVDSQVMQLITIAEEATEKERQQNENHPTEDLSLLSRHQYIINRSVLKKQNAEETRILDSERQQWKIHGNNLRRACSNGDIEAIKEVLTLTGDSILNAADADGVTALNSAVSGGQLSVVQLLLSYGSIVKIDAIDSALEIAKHDENEEIVSLLEKTLISKQSINK